jgi:hypothetical protein
MLSFRILAESDDSYEWIGALVFLFFVVVLPLLKKVGDAIAGKKGRVPGAAPGRREAKPEERGAVKEMLDEVEDFFRRGRASGETEQRARPGASARSGEGALPRLEMEYHERKRDLDNLRRRGAERLERSRLEPVAAPADDPAMRQTVAPVYHAEQPSVTSVTDSLEMGTLSSLAEERRREAERAAEQAQPAFAWMDVLPETARMIILSELLSPPKSLRETETGS